MMNNIMQGISICDSEALLYTSESHGPCLHRVFRFHHSVE